MRAFLVRLVFAAVAAGTLLVTPNAVFAQGRGARGFTHADTLRGGNTPERAWWDATFYDLHVRVNPSDSSVRGYNGITYRVIAASKEMQIDLQPPLEVDSIVQDGKVVQFRRDGNAFLVTLTSSQTVGARKTVTVHYHGRPHIAVNPPWGGGIIWTRDPAGNPWIATADQGLGASVWWPNKDQQADEPDSQRVAITVPDPMVDVSNGRLRSTTHNADKTTTFEWFVTSPINNYAISINAGTYAHYTESLDGAGGKLSLDFWPLAVNLDKAKAQFRQAGKMIACFERWFGAFPWYTDGYKLVEAPHLGMEHQSAVAYGNGYANGYRGRDLSGTGEGLKWDYIIVHESAHEWWGNNITAKDVADNWIHEGLAYYAEGLYSECQDGKQAGATYLIGSRRSIRNDRPLIATYGVMSDYSGDIYPKGANLMHTIRQIVNDDDKWRSILHGLQTTFARKTVTTAEFEAYITKQAGTDLTPVFNQYLRTTMIPSLEYRVNGTAIFYRWANVVPGFNMPVRVSAAGGSSVLLYPTDQWKTVTSPLKLATDPLSVDENFYVTIKRVEKEEQF